MLTMSIAYGSSSVRVHIGACLAFIILHSSEILEGSFPACPTFFVVLHRFGRHSQEGVAGHAALGGPALFR